jgi:hypothetical protein
MLSINYCRHHNGYMNDTCEAGVKYLDVVTDPENDNGLWLRMPCSIPKEKELERATPEALKHYANKGTCPKLDFPTAEEARIAREESDARFAKKMQRLAEGFCLQCDQPMTKRQVGRCVYAEPCGHRLYQGKA